ncbi:MAG: hypothetical protein HKN92_06540 [Chitinophagales bacterium]|nr:hypothetical protein [Chitinophagales bacterium]
MDIEKNKEGQNMIVEALKDKACTKQKIYKITHDSFDSFKRILQEYMNNLQDVFSNLDPDVHFEYRDNGEFESSIKFSGDTLVFNMHSNIFNFDDSHAVHQMPYVQEDPLNVYCGMIEIYNFLSDSFRYQRLNDTGYLIARVFINREKHFFIEGERQLGFLYNDFENMEINDVYIKAIIEASILYAIEFDLWVPSYQDVREITVSQKLMSSGVQALKTAKRMGFKFQAEHES